MRLKLFCLFVSALLLSSCYFPNTLIAPKEGVDFDKVVKANDISFFGGFKYDANVNSKKQHHYTLLYKGNILTGIYLGRKTSGSFYKVLYLDDALSMICSLEMGPRYLAVDTLIFYKNEYFRKTEYNEPTPERTIKRWAGMTRFTYYNFKEKQCDVYSKSCSDSIAAFRSIIDYAYSKKSATSVPLDVDETMHAMEYPDKEAVKFTFFRNYIR